MKNNARGETTNKLILRETYREDLTEGRTTLIHTEVMRSRDAGERTQGWQLIG